MRWSDCADAQIRTVDWSALLLFANPDDMFSRGDETHKMYDKISNSIIINARNDKMIRFTINYDVYKHYVFLSYKKLENSENNIIA